MINDDYILNYFYTNNKRFKSSVLRNLDIIDNNINNYLINRFNDSIYKIVDGKIFYIYILKRILYKIEEHPKCKKCNKLLNLNNFISQHIKYCSSKCAQSDNELRNKIKQTKSKRYGDKNYVNTEKAKQTCFKKYGVEYTGQLTTKIEKSNKTWFKKYGTCSPSKLDKTKETLKTKYNVDNVFQIKNIIKIIQQKRYETMKKNNSFNKSTIEEQIKEYFDSHNIIYKYQYKSKLYPFACDFYLTDYNLYIEIQGTWTHGSKPFEGTLDDLLKLQHWSEKNTKYYDNAIDTWCIRDVKKRNIAKQNKLNYIELFSYNIDYCINEITKKING